MINLNRLTKQVIVLVIGFIAFLTLLGYAGSVDYAEQVVHNMPQEAYEHICLKLGDGCTDRQIAAEYMDRKEHYDSLSR